MSSKAGAILCNGSTSHAGMRKIRYGIGSLSPMIRSKSLPRMPSEPARKPPAQTGRVQDCTPRCIVTSCKSLLSPRHPYERFRRSFSLSIAQGHKPCVPPYIRNLLSRALSPSNVVYDWAPKQVNVKSLKVVRKIAMSCDTLLCLQLFRCVNDYLPDDYFQDKHSSAYGSYLRFCRDIEQLQWRRWQH